MALKPPYGSSSFPSISSHLVQTLSHNPRVWGGSWGLGWGWLCVTPGTLCTCGGGKGRVQEEYFIVLYPAP